VKEVLMKYTATESVKVGPEQFANKGQTVEVVESNAHIDLLVAQGLLVSADEVVTAPAVEVEVPVEKPEDHTPDGKSSTKSGK
jgi:hypothetical protein